MRKRIILLLVVACTATLAFGQSTGLESVLENSSFGVYGTELDAALNVDETGNRPGFSELDQKMIFGGNANLNFTAGIEAEDTFTAAVFNPLWLGIYMPGDLPFSLFTGSGFVGATGNEPDGTSVTGTATEPVVDGTTTTNIDWATQTETFDYTANRLFDDIDQRLYFQTRVDGMNIGAYLVYIGQNNRPQADNYVLQEENFYNTAAAGEAPTPALDYRFTETRTADGTPSSGILFVATPLYLETGDLGHRIVPAFQLNSESQSTTLSESYTDPVDPAGGLAATVVEANNTTTTLSSFSPSVSYELSVPGVLSDGESDEAFVGTNLRLGFRGAQYEDVFTTQDKTWAGNGAAATLGARNDDSDTATYTAPLEIAAGINGRHSFYYNPHEMVRFGIIPGVELDFEAGRLGAGANNNVLITERVVIDRVDGNGDGDFEDAADTITTTTTEYEGTWVDDYSNLATIGNAETLTDIGVTLSLPASVQVEPAGWPFGVTLGSNPRLSVDSTQTTTQVSAATATVVTADGTGAVASTVVTQDAAREATSAWAHTVTVDAEHRIGLNMLFGDAGRLDVALNLSSGINILDFKDLVIQAQFKLD